MEYLQPTIGFFALLFLGAIFSENIKAIKLKYVVSGVLIQLILALLLLRVDLVASFFEYLSDGVMVLKAANDYGTGFVFGYLADGAPNAPFDITNPGGTFIFAFGGLTLIILMSAISALLWHWRIIPIIVNALSVLFKKPLNVGGPIGLGATANVFLGQVEAPLLVRPYLSSMTRHELLILMTVGMSTIAGSVMVVYTTMLTPIYGSGLIGHFLTASLISVPAGIMFANMMIPSEVKTDFPEGDSSKMYTSTVDALTQGTKNGLEIFLSVIAMLIVVMALVFLVNSILGIFPDFNGSAITIERILGYIFAPLAWFMGIPWEESLMAGQLLGVKTALNEFVAYLYLSDSETYNLSEKSRLIMLYALCGFANFSSVGILLSGMSAMVPERRDDLISVTGKALWAALLASCMTGFIVGII
ncbi:MAG TPA: nucleoside transporter C-terminal domain-containing protein [SAR86 cluster bacterium]|jgi:CNT family concentrative nucleoside transporter|nr:nucleoside transporter C-terminal domain-containing protein [SAR86 cluster bacterium]HJM14999.1 nucleoside transporter C-terminal domain-containing protein [SAR86 cluster bacterium]